MQRASFQALQQLLITFFITVLLYIKMGICTAAKDRWMTLRLGAAMILLLMRYASTQTYCGMWRGNWCGIGTVAPKKWRSGEDLYELGSSTWQAALEL